MKFFRGLKLLRKKLILMCLLLLLVPSLIVGVEGYQLSKKQLDESGKMTLQNNVRMAINVIGTLDQQVKEGNLSLEEAQEQAKTTLMGKMKEDGTREGNQRIDLGEHGYFFIESQEGMMLGHPKIEGKNAWDDKSPDGLYFTREMIKKAQNGGGFVAYPWALPNDPNKVAPKISYAELDPNWGWVVAAGSYMMDFNQGATEILKLLTITLIISLICGVIITFLFASKITKPIIKIADHAKRISDGDLTVDQIVINTQDEVRNLADDFNTMVSNLKTLILEVHSNSEHVSSSAHQLMEVSEDANKATEQIATTIQEVAIGSEKQANYVKENASIINDMSSGIQQIAASAQHVSDISIQATEKSVEGNKNIQTAVQQMNDINNTVNHLAEVVNGLGERSKEIVQFIKVISDISEQTNLLALNASIEAARAGEHGKGFAVVAEEVRKLAEQSAESAKHISGLISVIQSDSTNAEKTMDKTKKEVAGGIGVVNKAGQSFEEIQHSINEVKNQIQEVSAAAKQMSVGTSNVVQSIESISEVAEQSAASTQNISAATEEQLASMEKVAFSSANLSEMAKQLQKIINQFKL